MIILSLCFNIFLKLPTVAVVEHPGVICAVLILQFIEFLILW